MAFEIIIFRPGGLLSTDHEYKDLQSATIMQ